MKPAFYQKISQTQNEDGSYLVEVELNPAHPVYAGHFPGNPVAPGVCLTQMVKELANGINGTNYSLTEARDIKFLAVVNPFETPRLQIQISISEAEAGYNISCTAAMDGTSYFKLNGKLGKL